MRLVLTDPAWNTWGATPLATHHALCAWLAFGRVSIWLASAQFGCALSQFQSHLKGLDHMLARRERWLNPVASHLQFKHMSCNLCYPAAVSWLTKQASKRWSLIVPEFLRVSSLPANITVDSIGSIQREFGLRMKEHMLKAQALISCHTAFTVLPWFPLRYLLQPFHSQGIWRNGMSARGVPKSARQTWMIWVIASQNGSRLCSG